MARAEAVEPIEVVEDAVLLDALAKVVDEA